MSFVYLASPYSSPDEAVRQERYEEAQEAVVWGYMNGHVIYSPIVHCHELVNKFDLPGDFGFWRTFNEEMIRPSGRLWILQIPGWQDSKGIASELAFSRLRKYEICWMKPDVVEGYLIGTVPWH